MPWQALVLVLAIAIVSLGAFAAYAWIRARRAGNRAELKPAAFRPGRLENLGTTRTLTVLPLVDWHTVGPKLRGEPGVSYLVATDHHRILFDVGLNRQKTSPSPLEHNMAELGLDLGEIDTIFISHNHGDHVGGLQWARAKTFSAGNEQADLRGKRVFTPVPMTYPGLEVTHAAEPTVIGPGLATIGPIGRQLFLGWVEEHALAVNVEGKGIVLIVGCGHQTLPGILERACAVFAEPIHGVIGGLHYPVPRGRFRLLGLDAQRLLASGTGPLHPITMDDVEEEIEALRKLRPRLVAISGHDSSDQVIERFREAFGPAYRDLRVGEEIPVAP